MTEHREPMSDERLAELLADWQYDIGHDCEHYSYADGRCYFCTPDGVRTSRMCRYEPKCHDENVEGRHYRLVSEQRAHDALLAERRDNTVLRAEVSALAAQVRILVGECMTETSRIAEYVTTNTVYAYPLVDASAIDDEHLRRLTTPEHAGEE